MRGWRGAGVAEPWRCGRLLPDPGSMETRAGIEWRRLPAREVKATLLAGALLQTPVAAGEEGRLRRQTRGRPRIGWGGCGHWRDAGLLVDDVGRDSGVRLKRDARNGGFWSF